MRRLQATDVAGGELRKWLALLVLVALISAGAGPAAVLAAREGETEITASDTDGDGQNDHWDVDWDGDGYTDESWDDTDGDGEVDYVEVHTGGDDARSPRGKPGTRVRTTPLSGGGTQTAADWDGDGRYDEVWWDYDGDGTVDDTDVYATESKVLDNTKSTRFRGVFVGAKNGLDYPEKDVEDLTRALGEYPSSWSPSDMTTMTGSSTGANVPTPANIQAAIDAAKAASKPGDEFIFYFSGHGGGYDKDDGWSGGAIDADGDETAIKIPERQFGSFDGSDITTPAAGYMTWRPIDMSGDGQTDTAIAKYPDGSVIVWRWIDGAWKQAGQDTNGDQVVDGADGGVDVNGDGDKDDEVAVDDTILVAGRAKVTDDMLTTWLSGFPESVTIVVILDSCYSGSFTPDLQRIKDKDGKPLRPGHMEVLTAAPADDEAWEMPVSNGVLTQAILDALTRLPDSITGGHATSAADFLGNEDDITTTRELARIAAALAAAYTAEDNDGDGLFNEDGAEHSLLEENTQVTSPDGLETSVTPEAFGHLDVDNDGDGKKNEDPKGQVQSFFDVYLDPGYGREPVPQLFATFHGDAPISVTGMAPAISLWSDAGIAPGTSSAAHKLTVKQVPRAMVQDPPPGLGFASEVYDIDLWELDFYPELDEMRPDIVPYLQDSIPAEDPPVGLYATLQWREDAGGPMPAVWNESTVSWDILPVAETDPANRLITFLVPHLSRFALLYPGPSPTDTTAPGRPRLLDGTPVGDDLALAWANATDPDLASTRILRSTVDFATGPDDTSGQTLVYDGLDLARRDPSLEKGIAYHYTAYSRDKSFNWSAATTLTAAIPTQTVLAVSRSASVVSYGASARIRGVLKDMAGTGLGGKTLELQSSSNGTTWSRVKDVTSATETYDAYVKPVNKTYYRYRFAGDLTHLPSTGNVVAVTPRVYLSRPYSPSSVYRGRRFSSYGYLKPRHTARAKTVRLQFFRYESRRWKLRKTSNAVNYNYSNYTKYKNTTYLPYRGRWKVRAYAPTDAQHYTTIKGYDYIKVK